MNATGPPNGSPSQWQPHRGRDRAQRGENASTCRRLEVASRCRRPVTVTFRPLPRHELPRHRQRKTQASGPIGPLSWCFLERMTRFELATLTLARWWSPSVQSVYCAAAIHSPENRPENRPGNPSRPSGPCTGLPSPNGLGPSELCCATTPGLSFRNRRLCRRALCARGAPWRRDSVSSRSNPTKAHTVRRRHIFTSGQCLSPR